MAGAESQLWSLLADATVVMHAGFVLFVVGGQVLILAGWAAGWHWVRGVAFRLAHLAAIGFVVAEAWLGLTCPLTLLERHLRRLAGEPVSQASFIGQWTHRLLYYDAPPWVFTAAYTAFALIVVATLVLCPPRRRGAR